LEKPVTPGEAKRPQVLGTGRIEKARGAEPWAVVFKEGVPASGACARSAGEYEKDFGL